MNSHNNSIGIQKSIDNMIFFMIKIKYNNQLRFQEWAKGWINKYVIISWVLRKVDPKYIDFDSCYYQIVLYYRYMLIRYTRGS